MDSKVKELEGKADEKEQEIANLKERLGEVEAENVKISRMY